MIKKIILNENSIFVILKIQNIEKYENYLKVINSETRNKLNKNLTDISILNVCSSPLLLSRQLTHIELV